MHGTVPLAGEWIDFANVALGLARGQGRGAFDAWGHAAHRLIPEALAGLAPIANHEVRLCAAEEAPGTTVALLTAATARTMPPLLGIGPTPHGFAEPGSGFVVPEWRLARVADGVLVQFAQMPLVLTADGKHALREGSGRYAALLHHMPIDLAAIVAEAREVPGALFVLGDDIWPLNYAHFLLDWLPRLHALGGREDVAVAVPPLHAPFAGAALERLGLAGRIVVVPLGTAVRARELWVTTERPSPPHPAFRASAWALRFLRERLGAGLVRAAPEQGGEGLLISRADGTGRGIENEAELFAALAPLGFRLVVLSGLDLAEQARLFATAPRIVAAHGAGLANLAFASPGAQVVEIFAADYATDAFRMVACHGDLDYRYLVTADLTAPVDGQTKNANLRVDVPSVLRLLD